MNDIRKFEDLIGEEFTLDLLEELFPDYLQDNLVVSNVQGEYVSLGVVDISKEESHIPSDWLDISDTPNGCIQLLATDLGDGECCFSFDTLLGGPFEVNWGDGVIEQYPSGSEDPYHKYKHGKGAKCSLGYTMFKVLVRAVNTGDRILGMKTSFKYTDYSTFVDLNINSKLNRMVTSRCQYLIRATFKTNIMEGTSDPMVNVIQFDQAYNMIELAATDNILTLHNMTGSSVAWFNRGFKLKKMPAVLLTGTSNNMNSSQLLNLEEYWLKGFVNAGSNQITAFGKVCLIENVITTNNLACRSDNMKKLTVKNCSVAGIDFNGPGHLIEEIVLDNVNVNYIRLGLASGDAKRMTTSIKFLNGCVFNGQSGTDIYLLDSIITANQLNELFAQLPIPASGTRDIEITGCVGAATCDRTIANARGWNVIG